MVAHITPDISYGLECAIECFDITSDVMTYYYRFNNVDLASFVDNHRHSKGDVSEGLRHLSRIYMKPYNDWFWRSANEVEQAWCLAGASKAYGRKSAELIDHLVKKFISKTLSNSQDPASRSVQQTWLDHCRQMNHAAKISAQLVNKVSVVNLDDLLQAIRDPATFRDRLPPLVSNYHHLAFDTEVLWDPIRAARHKPLSKAIVRKQRQERISVLKKSSAFLSRLVGTKNVSMFVGGKEIRVEGQRYLFSIHKNSIAATDYGALRISVHDRSTDIRIFDLCWYVDNTPALDQLSALILAVKCGDEDEIIKVGNILRLNHDALKEHEHLKSLIPEDKQALIIIGDSVFRGTGEIPPDTPVVSDWLSRYFHGTEEYYQSHPQVYLDFATRCAERLRPTKFPEELRTYFSPHAPQTIRPFTDGTVGRDLLPEPRDRLQMVVTNHQEFALVN